jgi:hypothetical protein
MAASPWRMHQRHTKQSRRCEPAGPRDAASDYRSAQRGLTPTARTLEGTVYQFSALTRYCAPRASVGSLPKRSLPAREGACVNPNSRNPAFFHPLLAARFSLLVPCYRVSYAGSRSFDAANTYYTKISIAKGGNPR